MVIIANSICRGTGVFKGKSILFNCLLR